MSESRRHALKMLGAIGASCAFPFAADELYGQHDDAPTGVALQVGSYTPVFLTPAEYAIVMRVSDLIIPSTDTPGAVEAGVPEYVDRVLSGNAGQQALARSGLSRLDQDARRIGGAGFAEAPEDVAIALLEAASDALDREARAVHSAMFALDAEGRRQYTAAVSGRLAGRPAPAADGATASEAIDDVPVRFFRLIKNLTADGYYTSRIGLLDELRYRGNTFLLAFPVCSSEA